MRFQLTEELRAAATKQTLAIVMPTRKSSPSVAFSNSHRIHAEEKALNHFQKGEHLCSVGD